MQYVAQRQTGGPCSRTALFRGCCTTIGRAHCAPRSNASLDELKPTSSRNMAKCPASTDEFRDSNIPRLLSRSAHSSTRAGRRITRTAKGPRKNSDPSTRFDRANFALVKRVAGAAAIHTNSELRDALLGEVRTRRPSTPAECAAIVREICEGPLIVDFWNVTDV
jgi:hypothetical protein